MRLHRHATSTIAGCLILALGLGVAACGLTSGAANTADTGGTGSNTTSANCGKAVSPTASSPTTSTGGTTVVTPAATGVIKVRTVTPIGTGTPFVGGHGTVTPAAPTTVQPAPNAPITPGQITVTTDKTQYTPCQPIQVVIANGLPSRIFVADHQTSCSIVTLQTQVDGQWQDVGTCQLQTPSRIYTLASGTAVMQTLVPGFGSVTGGQGRASGTYRVQFRYLTGPSPSKGTPPPSGQPVSSATFAVK